MSLRLIATAAATAAAATIAVVATPPAAHAGAADAPSAPIRYLTTPSATPVTVNVCQGATDPQGDTAKLAEVASSPYTLAYDPSACTVTLTTGESFWGYVTVGYKLTDGTNTSDWLTLGVSVGKPGNLPVVAQPDALTAAKNVKLLIPDLEGHLLANDSDPEGAAMSAANSSDVESGGYLPGESMLGSSYHGSKARLYSPPTDFVGTRRFTYLAYDGAQFSKQSYTITIVDKGPLQAPVAKPDAYVAPKDGTLVLTKANGVLANDTDTDSAFLRVGGFTQPDHGALTNFDSHAGTWTYTPDAGYTGPDSFLYTVTDPEGGTSSATVSITVKTLAPVAVHDSLQTVRDTPLVIPMSELTSNDSDADSSFSIANVLPGLNGTVATDHVAKTLTYTPKPGWTGTDTFGYRLVDPDGNYSGWANVAVTVVPPDVNQPPVAKNDSYQVRQGSTLTVPAAQGPLANDTDLEGAVLTIKDHSAPEHGQLSAFDLATGAFTYVPDAGWHGTETLTYRVADPKGAVSALGTLTIEVFNDAPVAQDDSFAAVPGEPLVVPAAQGLLVNDSDPEGEAVEVASWSLGQHGTLHPDSGGGFTYTPDEGFTGVETLTYRIRDEILQQSAPATITITVAEGTLVAAPPTVTGTHRVGRTLKVSRGAWGPAGVALAQQWLRDGKAITGATGTTYTLKPADRGHHVRVRVTGTRAGYASAERLSASTLVRAGLLTSSRPRIAGTPRVGRILTAYAGTWGPGTVSKTYRWYRSGKAITGATRATYRLTRADRGKRITVRVVGRKSGYATVARTSAYVVCR